MKPIKFIEEARVYGMNARKIFCVASSTVLLLTGCSRPDFIPEVTKAMEANLVSDFNKFEFAEMQRGDTPMPKLLFKGKDSVLLATKKPLHILRNGQEKVDIDGLARTMNGRFFSFIYTSRINSEVRLWEKREPCVGANCRTVGFPQQLTTSQAKKWIFDSDGYSPERYLNIFNEPAPPTTVPG